MSAAMSLKRKAVDTALDAAKKPKQNAAITSFFGAPKIVAKASSTSSDATAPATVPVTFDKEAWVNKLSPEHKDLLQLEIDSLHESWLSVLKDEVTSPEFLSLKRFLKQERDTGKRVFPPAEDIYSWCVVSRAQLPRLR